MDRDETEPTQPSPPEPPRRRTAVDVRMEGTTGEGLTGTAPATVYQPVTGGEDHTVAPDGLPLRAQPAWRQDFPIDWPEDHYVARRDFTKFTVLTSLAFAVGQFWIALTHRFRKRAPPAPLRIAAVDEVPVGGTLIFRYPNPEDACFLVRLPDRFVAYGQECTHLACAVIPKPETGLIHCPCHNGWFELEQGRPVAGPPRRPLPLVELEVREGSVFARAIHLRAS